MNAERPRGSQRSRRKIFGDTPVLFAYLFGSRATGSHRLDSDVDVAVSLEDAVPADRYTDVSLDLTARLSDASGIGHLEVVVMNRAPLSLLGRILRTRSVLYSRDEPARVRFESLTFRQFCDFEFHARELDEKFLRDMAEGRR